MITYDFIDSHCNVLLVSGGKKGNGLSSKTVTDVLSVIRNVLKLTIRKEMEVPCDGSAVQVKRITKPMRVLSMVEQDKLCRYILSDPKPYNIGILVCLFTTLRIGEICALRWEDVSLSEQTIHIHRTLQMVQNLSGSRAKIKLINLLKMDFVLS